jgi:hypothetical protein
VEAAILILLSTAVEHALESTNPVHALGAADGPSRYGTHQRSFPSFPCIDEVRALPHVAGFPDLRVSGRGRRRPDGRYLRPPFRTARAVFPQAALTGHSLSGGSSSPCSESVASG